MDFYGVGANQKHASTHNTRSYHDPSSVLFGSLPRRSRKVQPSRQHVLLRLSPRRSRNNLQCHWLIVSSPHYLTTHSGKRDNPLGSLSLLMLVLLRSVWRNHMTLAVGECKYFSILLTVSPKKHRHYRRSDPYSQRSTLYYTNAKPHQIAPIAIAIKEEIKLSFCGKSGRSIT